MANPMISQYPRECWGYIQLIKIKIVTKTTENTINIFTNYIFHSLKIKCMEHDTIDPWRMDILSWTIDIAHHSKLKHP